MKCNEVDCLEPLCTDFVVHKTLIFTIAVHCWQTYVYEILFIDTDIITMNRRYINNLIPYYQLYFKL